jgi:hypothetical protein
MEALPESKMMFLIRDSRDVVASQLDANRKGSWGEKRGVMNRWEYDTPDKLHMYTKRLAENYLREVSQSQRAYDAHNGSNALIRYEDLSRDTFSTLRDMYTTLGIEIDEAQLRTAIEKHKWERIPDTSNGSGQFCRRAHPGGWKEDLTPEQVKIVEDVTGPILSEFYGFSYR